MPRAVVSDSDNDDDVFIKQPTNIRSMYSVLDNDIQDSVSDEDNSSDEEQQTPLSNHKRKKPTKRGRGRPPSAKKPKPPPNPPPVDDGIIHISSDDDISSSPIFSTPDTRDQAAARALARAEAVLQNAKESHIVAEADAIVRRDALAERAREVAKMWQQQEQQTTTPVRSVASANDTPIMLKVRAPGHTLKMRIRTNDPLKKMLEPFCKKFGLDVAAAVMEVDGEQVDDMDTAATYDLTDNEMVDIRILSRR